MIETMDISAAQSAGLAELDKAAVELRASAPKACAATEKERLSRSAELRIDFAVNHHLNTKGARLSFRDPWLLPIYRDNHERKVIVKCVQIGISEYIVVYVLADAAAGRTAIDVLPTYDVRNRFVAQRVDRPLLLVPRYRELLTNVREPVDNRGLKQIGHGAVYFVSADSARSFLEIAGDTLIVDERDSCDAENLELAPDRLEHSAYPVMIRVGNPTHPSFGISADYDASDMREWQIKCRACNAWQTVDFFTNVLRVTRDDAGEVIDFALIDAEWHPNAGRDIRCYCAKCGAAVDRLEKDTKRATWIAGKPGVDTVGWRISHLMCERKSVAGVYAAWNDAWGNATKTARVINNVLGLSYSPAGAAVTVQMLDACKRSDITLSQSAAGPCTMGVDVGKLWDVRISDSPEPGIRRCRLVGRFAAMEPVLKLMADFNVDCCVIDARPETELARRFQEAAQAQSGRGGLQRVVWRCDFHRGENLGKPKLDQDNGIVQVDRTSLMDDAVSDIRNRRNWLPADASQLLSGEYYRQMMEPKRQLITAPSGEQRYIWTKGVDHQRLADAYDKLAGLIRPAPISTTFYLLG